MAIYDQAEFETRIQKAISETNKTRWYHRRESKRTALRKLLNLCREGSQACEHGILPDRDGLIRVLEEAETLVFAKAKQYGFNPNAYSGDLD